MEERENKKEERKKMKKQVKEEKKEIPEEKKKIVKNLVKLIKENPTMMLVSIDKISASNFQKVKHELKEKVKFVIAKKLL